MDNLLLNPITNKKVFDKGLAMVSLISLLIAGVIFGYLQIKNGGIARLCGDYNLQSIPFTMHINDYLKNWQGQWDWSLDLGTQFLAGYSFYNLFSPFLWLTLLFPSSLVPFIIFPIYTLKFVVAAATSYTYIKMFVKNNNYAVVGGLLYAFSGSQATNLMFHFHDAFALFPLMLIGLEKLMNEKKPWLFIFSTFLCCITNYFIFVCEVIILVLYFFLRFWHLNKKVLAFSALKVLGYGVLSVGLAGFVFIPNIYYILHSERATSSDIFYIDNLYYSVRDAFALIKGYIFPADAMNHYSTFYESNFDSLSAYLPLVGMLFVIAFWKKEPKSWLSRLSIILVIASFSPLITSLFFCGSAVYHRWFFATTLFLSLISCFVLDKYQEYNIKRTMRIYTLIVTAFVAILVFLPTSPFSKDEFHYTIVDEKIFIYQCFIVFGSLLLFWLLMKIHEEYRHAFDMTLLVFVSIMSLTSTYIVANTYLQKSSYGIEAYKDSILVMPKKLEIIDEQYRYYTVFDYTAITSSANLPGTLSFSSTVSPESYTIYSNFGFSYHLFADRKIDVSCVKGLPELLGAKYYIENSKTISKSDKIVSKFKTSSEMYYVVEKNACPIGFAYDSYVTDDNFEELLIDGKNNKAIMALESLVISKDDEAIVSKYLEKNTNNSSPSEIDDISDQYVDTLVQRNVSNSVNSFERTISGFKCSSNYEDDKIVFFSVPFDEGWSAKVNDKDTEIFVSNGMMYIIVPRGNSNISFEYESPLFKGGVTVSLVSILVLITYIVLSNLRKNFLKIT